MDEGTIQKFKYPPFPNVETIKAKLVANGHYDVAYKSDLAQQLALKQYTPDELTNMIKSYFPTMDIYARCKLAGDLVKKSTNI